MNKTIFGFAAAFCMCQSILAVRPIETEGFDLYRNSFKVDLVSLMYVAPQLQWEHFTDTRFSYGIYAQAHFVNRSSFRDLDKSPGKKVADDGETYDTRWDRRYNGVMICPEGRFYAGKKPARGFYLATRADMGIFRESFDVKRLHLIDGKDGYTEDDWEYLGNEKGVMVYGLGCGFGMGCQYYFGKNSHWGVDTNAFIKSDWKLGDDGKNIWEWLYGPGLMFDLNISILYRF